MNINRLMMWSVMVLCLCACVACPKQPARVSMVLAAGANLNPDNSGNALSVVVRIYQLKDKGRLEAADYPALLKSDKDVLSDDFLDRQERIVQPGAQELIELRANPIAAYLGVVALFRSPSGDTWRKIVPLKGKDVKLSFSLRENSIEIVSLQK